MNKLNSALREQIGGEEKKSKTVRSGQPQTKRDEEANNEKVSKIRNHVRQL